MSADLVAAVERLTREVQALKKAARQPARVAYRPSEVAAMLGCTAQTVREWIASGQLRAVPMNNWWLVPASAVDELLADQKKAAS